MATDISAMVPVVHAADPVSEEPAASDDDARPAARRGTVLPSESQGSEDAGPFRPDPEDVRIQLERALSAGALLQDRVFALSRELASAGASAAAERDRAAELARELEVARGRLGAAEAQVRELTETVRELGGRLAASEQTLSRFRTSLSWKVTKPLRLVGRVIRAFKQNPASR